MTNGEHIWELAEKYVAAQLTGQEFTALKDKLAADTAFAAEFHESVELVRSLKDSSKHVQFSNMVAEISRQQSNSANTGNVKTIPLKTYYWRTAAVAAGIALLTSLSTFWIIRHNNNKIESQYSLLKRDLEKYKRSQSQVINSIKQEQSKPEAQARYTGTGFAVSNDGYLVTNNHVIDGADSVYIQNSEGRYFKANVVAVSSETDLALLKVEAKNFRFGKSEVPYSFAPNKKKLGARVFSIGYPQDDIVYNEGYISAKNGFNGNPMQYQLELPANPGQSGAPVIDGNGNVIAIITGKESETEGTTFAVSSKAVLDLVSSLPKDNRIKMPKSNKMGHLSLEEQIEKLEFYTCSVRVYKK